MEFLYFICSMVLFWRQFGYISALCYEEESSSFYNINDGTRNVKSGVIKKISTPSEMTCVHRCKLQEGCQSINYNADTKECELMDGKNVTTQTNLDSQNKNWSYIYSVRK